MRGIGIQLENDIASQEQMMCESHTFYYNAKLYIPSTQNIVNISKMLNHGLNQGLFLSLFKLIPCPYIELYMCWPI